PDSSNMEACRLTPYPLDVHGDERHEIPFGRHVNWISCITFCGFGRTGAHELDFVHLIFAERPESGDFREMSCTISSSRAPFWLVGQNELHEIQLTGRMNRISCSSLTFGSSCRLDRCRRPGHGFAVTGPGAPSRETPGPRLRSYRPRLLPYGRW